MLEFLVVVVIHEIQAGLPDARGNRREFLHERFIAHVLFRIKRPPAKTDSRAVKDLVVLNHLIQFPLKSRNRNMRQNTAKARPFQLIPQPFPFIRTGSRNLYGLIANLRNPLQRLSKAFQCLAAFPDCIQLCANLHCRPSSLGSHLRSFA